MSEAAGDLPAAPVRWRAGVRPGLPSERRWEPARGPCAGATRRFLALAVARAVGWRTRGGVVAGVLLFVLGLAGGSQAPRYALAYASPVGQGTGPGRAAIPAPSSGTPFSGTPSPGAPFPGALDARRGRAPVRYPPPGAYDPGRRPTVVDSTWPALPRPGPDDWLHRFKEAPQTYDDFVAAGPLRPSTDRRTIAVMGLGDVPRMHGKLLERVAQHMGLYFGLEARLTTPAALPGEALRHRRQGDQYDGDELLGWLKPRLPAGALAMAALTSEDIFSDGLNFVFGVAWSQDRVALHSIARYGPDDAAHAALVLRRTLQTAAHEMGHVLGMDHCVFYACCMNGANTLEESDRTPIDLCPECRRKLVYATGVDLGRRDTALLAFYRGARMDADAAFFERRLRMGPGVR